MFDGFGRAFGAQIRTLREAASATQDQLARAVSRTGTGVRWTRARLGQVEAGDGTPDLASMYAVALALHQLSGHPVRLTDLLPESSRDRGIKLLRSALSGQPVQSPRATPPDPDPRNEPGWGQVEDRIAAELGPGSETHIFAAARKLYGYTGSEERDVRAGTGATPQKRGREARHVIAELLAATQQEMAESAPEGDSDG
jgi:transcriptional regulator with XRE-family HTH domain